MPDASNLGEDRLWTPADLARYLGYRESTVVRMASAEPHKLPPRVPVLFKPRWVPEDCKEWVRAKGVAIGQPRKVGRPRRKVDLDDVTVLPIRRGLVA